MNNLGNQMSNSYYEALNQNRSQMKVSQDKLKQDLIEVAKIVNNKKSRFQKNMRTMMEKNYNTNQSSDSNFQSYHFQRRGMSVLNKNNFKNHQNIVVENLDKKQRK